ncbi:uncharacterized protein [Drosophila takahashii]|uniref:uncharacterized protein n=1 Tax=Drosophila takahashii TaxID=29030 RepID=UPI003898F1BA
MDPGVNCSFTTQQGVATISLSCAQNKLSILPVYLNCNNWKQDFEDLYNWLLDYNGNNVMIVGDLNARIGEHQIETETGFLMASLINETRRACDKTADGNGLKLIELRIRMATLLS